MSSYILELFDKINEGFIRLVKLDFINLNQYSKEADVLVNRLMDEAEYLGKNSFNFTASFKVDDKVIRVWIENYPYSYGHPHSVQQGGTEIKWPRVMTKSGETKYAGVSFKTRYKLAKFISDKDKVIFDSIKVFNDA